MNMNEKTKLMAEFARIVVAQAVFMAEQSDTAGTPIKPLDMPNVFVCCTVTMMDGLKQALGFDHKTLNIVAQDAVNGLLLSLRANGYTVTDNTDNIDKSHVGTSVGDVAGSA